MTPCENAAQRNHQMQAYFNFCLPPQIPYLIARYAPAAPLLCVLETPRRNAARSSVEPTVKTDDGHVAVEGHTFQLDPSGIATHGNKVFTGCMHFRKNPRKTFEKLQNTSRNKKLLTAPTSRISARFQELAKSGCRSSKRLEVCNLATCKVPAGPKHTDCFGQSWRHARAVDKLLP